MKDPEPLLPAWLVNPPRWVLWWGILISVAYGQVVTAITGRWTVRHSIPLPIFVAGVVVFHQVMKQKLPIFCLDIVRSWSTYVFAALIIVVNVIEWSR